MLIQPTIDKLHTLHLRAMAEAFAQQRGSASPGPSRTQTDAEGTDDAGPAGTPRRKREIMSAPRHDRGRESRSDRPAIVAPSLKPFMTVSVICLTSLPSAFMVKTSR